MPRRVPTYLPEDEFTLENLLATIGAGVLAVGSLVFVANVLISFVRPRYAPADPWGGHSLEWATTSPPPRFNFTREHPVPPVRSYAPLLDLREEEQRHGMEAR